jgi:tetratricopeptide (TPR) repeat protein
LSATDVVNFYELLAVAPTTPKGELEQKIKQARRKYQQRLGHPDLNHRQEAEKRLQDLTEAKRILLDDALRAAYDRDLASRPAPATTPGPGGSGNWLQRAQAALAINDYASAAYCAREARQELGESAELWSIQARASVGLGRLDDAVFEARQAVLMDPGNVDYHFDLGNTFDERGEWANALACYAQAERLNPQDPAARLAMAGTHLQAGEPMAAVQILEHLFAARPDRLVGDTLAMALVDMAEAVPAVRTADGYTVTSPAEVGRMRELSFRARQVVSDPDIMSTLDYMAGYLAWCEARHFLRRGWMRIGFLIKVVIGWFVLLFVLFLFDVISDDAASILLVLGLVGMPVAIVLLARQPGWKINLLVEREQRQEAVETWTSA